MNAKHRPVSGRASLLALATIAFACACAQPNVRPAPFRVRPDSVDPGTLLGPFTGRVVDAASDEPVAGALVYATWTLNTGYGAMEPGGVHEVVVSTDTDGNYRIPRYDDVPTGGSVRVSDFTLVIYKRGYVAYRSDRRFFDLGPRRDFAQKRNQVSLQRWRNDYSHLRHLRYVGGGAALSALTAWEAAEAGAELSGAQRGERTRIAARFSPLTGTRSVVAAQLINEKEIKKITGFDGTFETGPLGDEPDTSAYSSQHFKALGRPQTYDVAVRLWILSPDGAAKRFQDLVELLPQAERGSDIADESFTAREKDIAALGFLDKQRSAVVMVTCGRAQCPKDATVEALARTMYDNLRHLMPARTAPATEPAPTAPEPPTPAGDEQ